MANFKKDESSTLQLALPKGRMQEEVFRLLRDAGFQIRFGVRDYRPTLLPSLFDCKILKPQNIVEMVQLGTRDLGFAGKDWVKELDAKVEKVLDTGLDPVRVVAAAPKSILENGKLPNRPLVLASEYEFLSKEWIQKENLEATFVRSFGATEVFPPEDADCIVDNTATGSTLKSNQLEIVGEILKSSTRLYVNPKVLRDPYKRSVIDRFVLLLNSVLEARKRVMIEMNVEGSQLENLIRILPCMRKPTVSPLHNGSGFGVKAAVPKDQLTKLIPEIKAQGGTDIVVQKFNQIVP